MTVRYISYASIFDSKTGLQHNLEDVTNDEEVQKKLNEHEAYLFPLKYKPKSLPTDPSALASALSAFIDDC